MSNSLMASLICLSLSLGLPLLILGGLARLGLSRRTLILTGAGFALWLGLTGLLAARGLFRDFASLPPRLILAVAPPLLLSLVLIFHPGLQTHWRHVPLSWLIGFQTFRLPVEIFLWLLVLDGVTPIQMSFEGRNWDILTGLSALPVVWLIGRYPAWRQLLALGWNLAGLALLVNIVTVSILSMPTAFQMLHPANTFVAELPFVWLPALLVPLAYTGHLIALRQLWLQRLPAASVPAGAI